MLFIKELKPTLNTQSDSIRAKLFYSPNYFIYSFVLLFSSVSYILVSYHLPFVTLSTYFHIFIAFYILTCDFTSYMQSSIRFFKLENDLREVETSSNYFATFYLKLCFEETSY